MAMAGFRTKCACLCSRVSMSSRYFSGTATNWRQDLVGFVGLGNMGAHMARNLLKKGHELVIYDLNKEACTNLLMDGAKIASSPASVAELSDRIVTMLPASQHVKEAYQGDHGILSELQPGTLLIDCSTIDPSVSQEMADMVKEHGAKFVDAPVSGGVNAARDAALTFMVGGATEDFMKAKTLLALMGKNVVHCGAVGNGQAAKICNNMLLAISMIGTSETMNLGMKLGLDPKLLASILNTSSGRCWSSEVYNPVPGVVPGVPSSNDYKGGFGTALMTKDLGLAQNAASSVKAFTPLGSSALSIYKAMCDGGYSLKDFSSAFQYILEEEKKSK